MRKLFTSIITPIDNHNKVDYEEFSQLLEHLSKSRSDGVIIGGLAGEGCALDNKERILLAKTALNFRKDTFQILLCLMSNNTNELLKWLKACADLEVDGYVIPLPYFVQPNQDGLIRHFSLIAKHAAKPVYIYSSPSQSGCSLSFESLSNLIRNPKIIGIINDSLDLDLISAVKSDNPSFFYLAGNERTLLPYLKKGADGVVAVSSHIIGEDIKEVLDNYEKDIINPGLVEYINLIADLLLLEAAPVTIKYILSHSGFLSCRIRLPLAPITISNKKKIDAIIN